MILAAVAVALGACAQWTAGFGFALVCGPLVIAALGQSSGLRVVLTLGTLIGIAMLAGNLRRLQWREALLLAAPGIVLTPFLVVALRRLDKNVMTVAAGLLTLAATAALARGLRVRRLRGPLGAGTAGAVSAAMNVLGGLSGPAAALYAVNTGWPQDAIRPTLQVFGILLNVTALISLGGPAVNLPTTAALAAGAVAGQLLVSRLSATTSRRVVLAIAGLGGLYAVIRGAV